MYLDLQGIQIIPYATTNFKACAPLFYKVVQ